MSPPLPTATTVRLPEDLVAWLDEKVRSGLYKSRSDAIRELLEAVSEAPSPVETPAAPAVSARPFEWFVVPLVYLDPNPGNPDPGRTMFVFQNDRLAPGIPDTFVPFGILADGPRGFLERFWVSEPRLGGGACLLRGKRLPLELACEHDASVSGLPSRLLFEPYVQGVSTAMILPALRSPNWFEVEISRSPVHASTSPGRSAAARFANSAELEHHVLLYPTTLVEVEPTDPPDNDAGTIRRRVFPPSPISRCLRDVLDEAGLIPSAPLAPPALDLPRIGLLAVRPEHLEELLERLKGVHRPRADAFVAFR